MVHVSLAKSTWPLAHGFVGVIPGGYDFSSPDNAQMSQVDRLLREAHQTFGSANPASDNILPVGVGFVLSHPSVRQFTTTAIPLLQRHRISGPVWLFAPHPEHDPSPLPELISAIHDAGLRVVMQVGTVAAAREALRAGADVIVAQGADAGGHQFAKVAGTIALVPEIRDSIDEEGRGKEVALLSAGGIVDGRGVAAALALGADGVVIGTRVSHDPSTWWQCD
jgi:nitronate monooxygenase